MKEIKNIYGMPKKSWKRFCDGKILSSSVAKTKKL